MTPDGKVQERSEIEKKDRWNVEALYENWDAWDLAFNAIPAPLSGPRWPSLSQDAKDLSKPETAKKILDETMKIDLELTRLYTYAHLRHDEDVGEEKAKASYMQARSLLYAFREEISWFDPALLQLSEKALENLLSSSLLEDYLIYLKKIVRLKPYILSGSEEKLMTFAEKALDVSHRAFGSLNNADLKFPLCKNEKGELCELTLGTYQLYMKSYDRTLRKEAFIHLHKTFGAYENTLSDLLQGEVTAHVFRKKARGYPSCLTAALYPNLVEDSVYTSLIRSVRKHLPSLHEYVKLRKKALKYDSFHVYDLSVPMVEGMDAHFSYEEAVEAICESVAVLGKDYQSILREGLTKARWVDLYENKRKRSGAYSSGCYGSFPYILMNYHGTFRDVMTLTHEAGHSMHTYFSGKCQKYQDHQYPIFLAEVASTFHEELLFRYFLEKTDTPDKRAYLINQKIDDIRNTLFRQTLFAEFELFLHETAEKEQPITPALLKERYFALTKEYFGEEVEMDPEVAFEWSRIPHFYYNFYVYQYATGISAAHVLAKRVLRKEASARESYLGFLSSGGSKDPIATLKYAGVDMTSEESVDAILTSFKELVKELGKLMENKS